MFETPSGPCVRPIAFDHDQRDDLLERDRHHREVMAPEPQRRHAEERARPERQHAAGDQADPVAQVQIGGSDADGIGAETEEGRLREIDLSAQAEHDGETNTAIANVVACIRMLRM